MKLSIIICIYNTEYQRFEQCLKSLTESTLKLADYEICIVDDGSSIDYSELVKKYCAKYIKTENRGIFHARMKGIEMAMGDYIAFCDSDDTVSINYHMPMLDEGCIHNSDIIINDWAFHTDNCRYYCSSDSTILGDFLLEGDDALSSFMKQAGREHSFFVLWNKVYKANLLKMVTKTLSSLRDLPEKYNYSEDALINFYAFMYAKRVQNIHTGYYYYRIHSSQSVNVITEERLRLHIECMSYTLNQMESCLAEMLSRNELLPYAYKWRELMSRTHYSYARNGGYTQLYPYIKERYRVNTLKKSTLADSSSYARVKIIPSNIDEIDSALLSLIKSKDACTVNPKKLDSYALETVNFINKHGGRVEFSEKADIVIPKPQISIKNKLIHNYYLYNIGIFLFPKGSKIRSFLKKIL